MSQAFGGWQPSTSANGNAPQIWTNAQTGQRVYGTLSGPGMIRIVDQTTGQPSGYHVQVGDGQVVKDVSLGKQFLSALPKVGAVVGGGMLLGALTAGTAGAAGAASAGAGADAGADAGATGAGTVTDTLPITGTPETLDANGLVTSSVPNAATTAGGFNWGKFLPQAFSTGLQSLLGARAASSAANQEKQAGQAAAQSFSPFAQGGIDAYNKALGMFGIAPVSAAPGSIAVRPNAPAMSAPQPYSLASFSPPIPQPQPGQPMPPQPYSLSTFSTGGR